jgi:hypothetical protein
MFDKITESSRADIFAADEAQPIEPLLVAEFRPVAQRATRSFWSGGEDYNRLCPITT